jgi:hypothetical protein
VHVVVANQLQTRKDRVLLVEPNPAGDGVSVETIGKAPDNAHVEDALVPAIVARHKAFMSGDE